MRVDWLTDQLAGWWSAQHVFFYRLTAGLGPFDCNICIPAARQLTAGGPRALTFKVIDGNSWKGQSGARSGFGVRFADYHNAGR
jgi:hypothetical protein